MKLCVVIVGVGLGGCMLVYVLFDLYEVVLVECGVFVEDLCFLVVDVGLLVGIELYVGLGFGGMIQFWYNGLIEIDVEIFDVYWFFLKMEFDFFYEKVFFLLLGISFLQVCVVIDDLCQCYCDFGLFEGLMQGLYYLCWLFNLWELLKLQGWVEVVCGDVVDFELDVVG